MRALGILWVGLLSPLLVHTVHGESSNETSYSEAREKAAHRERRIIFYNDGNEPVYYCKEATAKALLDKRTTALVDTHVDSIFYCTWSSGFGYFTHDTKVGYVFDVTAEEPGKGPGSGFSRNKTRAFIEQGNDPLDIMVDFCKRNDIEIFWSMRMNDVHDAWGAWYSPHLMPPIKKEHPEWMMGTAEDRPVNGGWTAIDFGVPEVRELTFQFFKEVCENYDVDGVQLDFFRHLTYFRAHAEGRECGPDEWAMMTGLIQRIRTMADDVGRKRGRPILISVRVPDSLPLCKAVGLDVEQWMKDDLIDLLVVSGYFRLNPWETSVELGHKYGVPVYPCLSESRIRDDKAKSLRQSVPAYRARAMNVWQSGADGVYMFNFFNPGSPLWNELGEPDTLRSLEKVYTTATRGLGNLDFWFEGGERYAHRDIVTPDTPLQLEPGATKTVTFSVGETPNADIHAPPHLGVRLESPEAAEALELRWNDHDLDRSGADDLWALYSLESEWVQAGKNSVSLELKGPPEDGGQKILDLALWLKPAKR